MKRTLQVILAWLSLSLRAFAEEAPDFQVRIPFHVQYPRIETNEWGSLGLAAWALFPDVTAKGNETSTLNVVGPMFTYGGRGSWIEVLGGFRANDNGYMDPIADLRFLDRSFTKVNIFGELGYFPRAELRRMYVLVGADIPIPLGKYEPRLGFESEDIISYAGKKDSLGIGPRVLLPLPLGKFIPGLSSSVALAYQFRNDRDFLRCYLGFTYTIGKK